MVPTLRCRRRQFGEVAADPSAPVWRDLDAVELRGVIDGDPPKQGTTVKSVWSDEEWRVLFEITDDHVWATLTERGALLYQEEVVEVFVDPVGDLECYFEIEVNPLNAVLELVLRKNRSGYVKDMAWRCEGLRTCVQKTAAGWCAELAIPFGSLTGVPPRAGDRWRGNFCRIDRPPNVERELSAWSPPGRANFHTPERFGWIEFRP
jgi:hypothetical protein